MKIEDVLYLVFLIAAGIIIATGVNYAQIAMSNTDDYFWYTSLETEKKEYSVGEDILIISKLERKEPIYMDFQDILRCDNLTGATWFSSTNTESKKISSIGHIEAKWRYEGDLPEVPTTCFIDSYPTAILDFGIKKTQNIQSNTFTIR